jgi:hypothetical protein
MQSIEAATYHLQSDMGKDWVQVRIERTTARELDDIHIERRESYNDIIKRLVKFWVNNPDRR